MIRKNYIFEAVISGQNISERTIVFHSVSKAAKEFGVSTRLILNTLNYINASGHNSDRFISHPDSFWRNCNVNLIGIQVPTPPTWLFVRPYYDTKKYNNISSYYVKFKNKSRNRSEKIFEVESDNHIERIVGVSNLLRHLIDCQGTKLDYLKNNDLKFHNTIRSLSNFLKNKKFSELRDFKNGNFGNQYIILCN